MTKKKLKRNLLSLSIYYKLDKDLIRYFIEQVKEEKMLNDLYNETIMDMQEFLKGKPKTLKKSRQNKTNKKLWKQ